MESKLGSYMAAISSVSLFVMSLFQDTVSSGWPGWGALLFGWFEVVLFIHVGPFVAFAWLANPLLIFVWIRILIGARRHAVACAAVGFILGFLLLFGQEVISSESGDTSPIEYGFGYWLWLASLAMAFIGAILVPAHKTEAPTTR